MPVTLSPLGGAAQQFFDNNGVILSGGKIYTYVAGTTTPSTVYTSAAGATAHANPIILDSSGRVPGGEIWLNSGSSYKFVIETSLGILLGTYDNISGVSGLNLSLTPSGYTTAVTVQEGFDNLGSSTGSAYVGFLQSGPNAVSQSSLDKMRERVSVADFGAVGDGVTDDTTAFNNAVAALVAKGGGTLYIPEGKFLLEGTVVIAFSGIWVAGESPSSSWIVTGSVNGAAIQFGDGINTYYRCGIERVVFGAKNGIVTAPGNCGLKVVKNSNFTLMDTQVFDFPAKLNTGIIFDNTSQSFITNIGVQSCFIAGVYFINNSLDIYIVNGRSDNNTLGWHIDDCQGLYFTNCSGYGNSTNAWRIESTVGNNTKYLFFANCVGDTSGSHNWYITDLIIGVFTGCWGSTQTSQVTNTFANGFFLTGTSPSDVRDILFSNCTAFANNSHGFSLYSCTHVSLSNCMGGSETEPFAGNGQGGAGSGAFIDTATQVTVTGGQFTGNVTYGIDLSPAATDVTISSCNLKFNDGAQLSNAATSAGSNIRIQNVAGYNPLMGVVTQPAVPASGVEVENTSGSDCMVYIVGGTVSNIQVGVPGSLSSVASTTPFSVYIPAGAAIKLTYSVAPTWQWSGL